MFLLVRYYGIFPENNFTTCIQVIMLYNEFENHTFEIIAISARG